MTCPFGRHIIAELFQCQAELLDEPSRLKIILVEAAQISGTPVLEAVFRSLSPNGIIGVVITPESHLAVHTFPGHRYAAVDIYTHSRRVNPNEAYHYIANQLQASCTLVKELLRGFSEVSEDAWTNSTG